MENQKEKDYGYPKIDNIPIYSGMLGKFVDIQVACAGKFQKEHKISRINILNNANRMCLQTLTWRPIRIGWMDVSSSTMNPLWTGQLLGRTALMIRR